MANVIASDLPPTSVEDLRAIVSKALDVLVENLPQVDGKLDLSRLRLTYGPNEFRAELVEAEEQLEPDGEKL